MREGVSNSKIYGSSGRPLIVLHGLLGSGDNWASFARYFSTRGIQVHVLDARNHGESFRSGQMDYPSMADDVAVYLNERNIDRAIVLGHSMGGKTAMSLSDRYPSRVEKLIVVDITPRAYPLRPQEDILRTIESIDLSRVTHSRQVIDRLEEEGWDASMAGFIAKNLKKNPSEGNFYWAFDHRAILHALPRLSGSIDLQNRYPGPALFIKGENSSYWQKDDFSRIQKHFPFARERVIENTGHWPHVENPEGFKREVSDFLGL